MKHIIAWLLAGMTCFVMPASGASTPLPADQAFQFSASLSQNHQLVFTWDIAPGYYLYRDRISFTPLSGGGLFPERVALPKGLSHPGLNGAPMQVYTHTLRVPLRLQGIPKGVLRLDIRYQGCSQSGFCYTPMHRRLDVNLSRVQGPALLDPFVQTADEMDRPSEEDLGLTRFLSGNRFLMVLVFLGLGLLLSFTPCVLPMVPILSAIIVGGRRSGAEQKSRSFLLSLAYVAGMAGMYALAGILVALVGRNIQTALQQPAVIVVFSGILVLLALSLFGFYELQLPLGWQRRLGRLTHQQKGGSFVSAFLMGCLSTLIVSPCVSAPLVAVLGFIGGSGDVWLGLLALASLGIGMGIPLLLIGLSAGKLLPRTGPWMTALERFFGVVMLIMAVWMFSRALPDKLSTDRPADGKALFVRIHSAEELDQALRQARRVGRPTLLDFYARWCIPCRRMDQTVFSAAAVRAVMQPFVRLRVDLTDNPAWGRVLLQRFQQAGPPAVLFFDCAGRLLTNLSLSGEVDAKHLMKHIQNTGQMLSCQVLSTKSHQG